MGQRDFAYCTSLEDVKIGNCGIYYDGTYQYCSKLKKFIKFMLIQTLLKFRWKSQTNIP